MLQTTSRPATRDRTIDLVRAASLLVVVVGHWLMAEVSWTDGHPVLGNALTDLPALVPLTWLLQVMPLFFLAGGVANARSLARSSAGDRTSASATAGGVANARSLARSSAGDRTSVSATAAGVANARSLAHAESSVPWLRQRVGRLLGPTAVLLGTWLAVAALLALAGVDSTVLRTTTKAVLQPLWFLAVYVAVVALAPVTLALHQRRPVATVLALAAGVTLLDVARFAAGWEGVALANYLLVWLLVAQAGYWWADGRLLALSPSTLRRTLVASLGALVTLVAIGPYPLSMVGLPGQPSNMSPPTLCLVLLAVAQVSTLLLARRALERWLATAARQRRVAVAGALAMPVFLWHLTALAVVALGTLAAGIGAPVGTVPWWALRLVRLGVAAAVLAALLVPVVRIERRRRPTRATSASGSVALAALATVALVTGLVLIATGGVWGAGSTFLPGPTVPPVVALATLALGTRILRRSAGTLPA